MRKVFFTLLLLVSASAFAQIPVPGVFPTPPPIPEYLVSLNPRTSPVLKNGSNSIFLDVDAVYKKLFVDGITQTIGSNRVLSNFEAFCPATGRIGTAESPGSPMGYAIGGLCIVDSNQKVTVELRFNADLTGQNQTLAINTSIQIHMGDYDTTSRVKIDPMPTINLILTYVPTPLLDCSLTAGLDNSVPAQNAAPGTTRFTFARFSVELGNCDVDFRDLSVYSTSQSALANMKNVTVLRGGTVLGVAEFRAGDTKTGQNPAFANIQIVPTVATKNSKITFEFAADISESTPLGSELNLGIAGFGYNTVPERVNMAVSFGKTLGETITVNPGRLYIREDPSNPTSTNLLAGTEKDVLLVRPQAMTEKARIKNLPFRIEGLINPNAITKVSLWYEGSLIGELVGARNLNFNLENRQLIVDKGTITKPIVCKITLANVDSGLLNSGDQLRLILETSKIQAVGVTSHTAISLAGQPNVSSATMTVVVPNTKEPKVRINVPQGGEKYVLGTKQIVTWTQENVDSVSLWLMDYQGIVQKRHDNIPQDLNATSGSFEWTVDPRLPVGDAGDHCSKPN